MLTKKKIKKIVLILIIIYLVYNLIYLLNDIHEKKLIKEYFNTNAEEINNTNDNPYVGVLEIPQINLQKGFYDLNNKNNNVNKNIQLLKNSTMPNENGSLLVIASHSGNGKKAFFKNLYKLHINDAIKLYYKDMVYFYEVKKIDNVKKNGHIYLDKEYENTLVLTTCSYQKNKQLVVMASLVGQKKLQ